MSLADQCKYISLTSCMLCWCVCCTVVLLFLPYWCVVIFAVLVCCVGVLQAYKRLLFDNALSVLVIWRTDLYNLLISVLTPEVTHLFTILFINLSLQSSQHHENLTGNASFGSTRSNKSSGFRRCLFILNLVQH